jgi:hypothetical protein
MDCQGCSSHQDGERPDLFVDITLYRADGIQVQTFEHINMNILNAPGRTLQFEDKDGHLRIIILGGNDRVEITSCEPLPKDEE